MVINLSLILNRSVKDGGLRYVKMKFAQWIAEIVTLYPFKVPGEIELRLAHRWMLS